MDAAAAAGSVLKIVTRGWEHVRSNGSGMCRAVRSRRRIHDGSKVVKPVIGLDVVLMVRLLPWIFIAMA